MRIFLHRKTHLKAKSDYAVNSTRYEALKKKLSLMGISTASLDNSSLQSSIRITAPHFRLRKQY